MLIAAIALAWAFAALAYLNAMRGRHLDPRRRTKHRL